jgi:hypothetical protein
MALWRLTLRLVVFFSLTLISLRVLSHRLPPQIPDIPSDLLPEHLVPNTASCESADFFAHRPNAIQLCAIAVEGVGKIRFAVYYPETKAISVTIQDGHELPLGNLVLAWGNPDTYFEGFGYIRAFWGQKIALIRPPLAPDSLVTDIHYEETLPSYWHAGLRWHGFKTLRRPKP